MTSEKSATRRRYSKELKAQVLAECAVSGASVAKVAMAHSINANVVHGWRKLAREDAGVVAGQPVEFVPVTLDSALPTSAPADRHIEIELRRGAVTMKLSWPLSAASDLVIWTRELLR